jgi:hypothetical protein
MKESIGNSCAHIKTMGCAQKPKKSALEINWKKVQNVLLKCRTVSTMQII